jgi:hypothetical protein
MAQQKDKALVKQGSTSLVEYGTWSPEAMEEESKAIDTKSDFWKVPVGKTVARFMPPLLGWKTNKGSPFSVQHQHFIHMPGIEQVIIFNCPKMHENKFCGGCQRADKLETSGAALDMKMAKKLRPQKRVLANVIIDHRTNPRLVIWAFGKTVYDQLKSIRGDDENGGDFLDPSARGFDIVVERKGTGQFDTEYTLTASRNRSPLKDMEWIGMQKDPSQFVHIPTKDQQERLLAGEDPRDVWGEGREDRGRRAPREDVIDVDAGPAQRTAEDDLFDDEVDLE